MGPQPSRASNPILQPQEGRLKVEVEWPWPANEVLLAGAMTGWERGALPLQRVGDKWRVSIYLEPGQMYQVKFIVDGTWRYHPEMQTGLDPLGNMNNIILVGSQKASTASPTPFGAVVPKLDPDAEPPLSLLLHLNHPLETLVRDDADPLLLPLPRHAVLGHCVSQPVSPQGPMVIASSMRHNTKYVTYLLYTPQSVDDS